MAASKSTLFLRVDPRVRDDLVAAARDAEVSLNAYCEFALKVYLEFLTTEEYQPHV